MGAWGYKLYEDDIAADIKEVFVAALNENDNCEEITKKILTDYAEELEDSDDGPIVWFALAETQWKKGMLLDYVKENAIKHIDSGIDLERWKDSPKQYEKRKQVLEELKTKLLSEQPPRWKKRVKKQYICPWNIGDVFAMQLLSEEAKYNNMYGRYMLLIKRDSYEEFNGDICPRFWVKCTDDDQLPKNVDDINKLKFIPSIVWNAYVWVNGYLGCNSYLWGVITTSKRVIPKNLIYLGNFDNIIPPEKDNGAAHEVYWKFVEDLFFSRYNRYWLGNIDYDWYKIKKQQQLDKK